MVANKPGNLVKDERKNKLKLLKMPKSSKKSRSSLRGKSIRGLAKKTSTQSHPASTKLQSHNGNKIREDYVTKDDEPSSISATDVRAYVVKQFMARKILGTGMPEITIVAKHFNLDEKKIRNPN